MPQIPVAPVKKAVLVGVHLKRDKVFGKVPGAHRDVKKLRDLLINTYQYDLRDITVLIDSEKMSESDRAKYWPTQENILQAMTDLVKDREAGDHIVFSFSGHGEQVVPIKDKNETDGKDEILIPADYEAVTSGPPTGPNAYQYSHFIRDDQIREIFVDSLAEGVQCTLIFDCCHSGTAGDLSEEDNDEDETKGSQPGAPGFTKNETVHHRHAAKAKEGDPNMAAVTGANGLGSMKEVTSWSACSDDQETYGGPKGGYFIDTFVDILRDANGKIMTNRDLLLGLRAKLETVTRDANSKRDETQPELKTPRPQLGSLIPGRILDKRFTL